MLPEAFFIMALESPVVIGLTSLVHCTAGETAKTTVVENQHTAQYVGYYGVPNLVYPIP